MSNVVDVSDRDRVKRLKWSEGRPGPGYVRTVSPSKVRSLYESRTDGVTETYMNLTGSTRRETGNDPLGKSAKSKPESTREEVRG